MKRYNITVPKKYTKNGEEKTQWNTVGSLVQFPATADREEGFILEMFAQPDVPFKVFPQRDREERPQKSPEEKSFDISEDPF